jgi:hypothetical protein
LKSLGFCDYGGSHTVTGVIEVSKALNKKTWLRY